jgi:hypothetical protein
MKRCLPTRSDRLDVETLANASVGVHQFGFHRHGHGGGPLQQQRAPRRSHSQSAGTQVIDHEIAPEARAGETPAAGHSAVGAPAGLPTLAVGY